jgi:hypothetical protein
MGASGDSVQLAAAADSILEAIQEWNIRHDWSFLLMDSSNATAITLCTSDGLTPATITTTVPNGFAGINIGQTITNSALATSTVASITSTTVIVLAGALATGTGTMTFSANIPIIANSDTYNLPTPIGRPYSARTLANEQTLTYKEQREIDRVYLVQSATRTPIFYNLFNTTSFSTSRQNGKIRLFPIPSAGDTLLVRYYRPISEPASGADNLDIPDQYVYALLALAKYFFLRDHDAESVRLQEIKERAEVQFRQVVARDEQRTEDNDMTLVPQMEHNSYRNLDSDDIRLVL